MSALKDLGYRADHIVVVFRASSGALRAVRGGSSRQALVKVGLGEVAVRWMSVLVFKGLSTLSMTR